MKYRSALIWLIVPIFLLSLLAAGVGVFYDTPGQPYSFTNHRGETVTINGHGLYFYDTVSSVAQMQANDLITLVVGLPLLAVSAWVVLRSMPNKRWALRGHLLLAGTLGFFLYTYLSMAMLASFNALFLVYVVLLTLSLMAFIFCLMSFDLMDLPRHFSAAPPRGWIAGLMFFVAAFLSLAWINRILTPLMTGQAALLENTTTMVIQAMDLGLIMPLALLGGVLLLRRSAWGYLLASVFIMKGLTMGLAVSTMSLNMMRMGVPESGAIMIPFLLITALNLVMAFFLFRNIDAQPSA